MEHDNTSTYTPSPGIKFEDSPAESLLSAPDEMYPSLFGTSSSHSPATTVNFEMLTPKSFADEKPPDVLSGLTALTQATIARTTSALTQPSEAASSVASTPEPNEPEKRPAKKRKSWGQVLPEPKTNLPPRKRAKTEDEKEQRRVERVLRNRRAAQSSRERKRLEVESLEKRNKELETALLQAHQTNLALLEEIQKLGHPSDAVTRSPSSLEVLRQNPITFSQQLFSPQDGHGAMGDASSLEQLLKSIPSPNTTVNPASLSPSLTPIPEAEEEKEQSQSAAALTPVADAAASPMASASPDATQHPAAMLCHDLQSTVASGPGSVASVAAPAGGHLDDGFGGPEAFDADRFVLESGLLASPNSSDLDYDHLAGDDASPFPFATGHYDFDFNDFITDGEPHVAPGNQQQPQQPHGRSVADASLFKPETPNPSEDPYLQPHSGASFDGCDDGGIAVSVL